MNKLHRSLLLTGIVAAGLAGCGDDVTVIDPPPPPPPPAAQVRQVTVGPDNVAVSTNSTIQMSVAVTQDAGCNAAVAWGASVAAVTVSGTGLVTIPAGNTSYPVAIRATATCAAGGGSGSGVATLNVTATTVNTVTVTPSTATINVAQSVDFDASVSGTNNPGQGVTWSTVSSQPTIVTIDQNTGIATGVAAGTANVKACSTVDNTKCGIATVVVVAPTPATVSIQGITFVNSNGQSQAVTLTNVFGQIEVAVNVDRGDKVLSRLDVLVDGAVVATQIYPPPAGAALAPATAPVVNVISTNTRQVRKANGLFVPVITNGNANIGVNLYVVGQTTPLASNTVPVVMNNMDALTTDGALAPLVFTPASPTAPTPFTDGGGTTWYGGGVDWASVNYIAFGGVAPTAFSIESNRCGDGPGTIAGSVTGGLAITGTFDCSGEEGDVEFDDGYDVTVGAPPAPEVTVTGPSEWSRVGSAFVVANDNPNAPSDPRYNLLGCLVGNSGASANGAVALSHSTCPPSSNSVSVDNVGPTINRNEIGFNAGCSGTIPNPGCWIGASYNILPDFPSTDGGSGVSSTSPTVTDFLGFDINGNAICGTTAFSAAALAEDPSPIKYDACATSADNLGNVSPTIRGFNLFGVDKTNPTIVYATTATYTPDSTLSNVIPAQTIDFAVNDNNAGIDGTMNIAFSHLVNNLGTATSSFCAAPSGALLAGPTGSPRQLVTPFAPDAGCGLPGYYYYDASVTDRAGNVGNFSTAAGDDLIGFGYEPGTGAVNFVNLNPFYGGGDAAAVTVFAGHTGADLANARVGMTYTTSGGNPAEFRFPFNGVFGAAWDNALYLATPAAGVTLSIPGTQTLGAVQEGAAPVAPAGATAAILAFNVEVQDVYGLFSVIYNAPVAPALKNTKFSTTNVWATPNIGTPTFSGAGACTFNYSTPTNGPTIPARVWVVDDNGAGVYDVLTEISAAPTLISDNGTTRIYQYAVSSTACATLAVGTPRLVAIKNDGAGVPVGYLVP